MGSSFENILIEAAERALVEFPDVELQPGINPKHPEVYTRKGIDRHFQRHVNVDFLIRGGQFPEPVRSGGRPDFEGGPKEPSVDICMIPLQNREGGRRCGWG